MLAHLDVVPAGKGWTVCEPFEPLVKDGMIYGRGSSDDKGPAVASLYALRCVREQMCIRDRWRIGRRASGWGRICF